jgi:hypothetical protein
MKSIAVLVPGIMGSALEYAGPHGTVDTLWGEDFEANYARLVNQPGTLRWTRNPARARLLRSACSFKVIRVKLWGGVLDKIRNHPSFTQPDPIEFGYDWRAPLEDSAAQLSLRLRQAIDANAHLTQAPKFTFITHSMGGVLIRIAIGAGALDPALVDRIIYIGSPLKGSPAAFRSAYGRIDLPFFQDIFHLFHWKNYPKFQANLLESIRTFPSVYYLLPPREIDYLFYTLTSRSNPLREDAMGDEHKDIAERAHQLSRSAREIIHKQVIPEYAIYTSVNSARLTDLEYRVVPLGHGCGYDIKETVGQTMQGDGTVPCDSARDDLPTDAQMTVTNVDHALMCNHQAVVACLNTLISQA